MPGFRNESKREFVLEIIYLICYFIVEHSKPLFSFCPVIRAFLFSDTLLEYGKHKRNIGKILWGEKTIWGEGYFVFTIRKVVKKLPNIKYGIRVEVDAYIH